MLTLSRPQKLTITVRGALLHFRAPSPADILISRSAADGFVKGVPDGEKTSIWRAAVAEALMGRCLESWEGIGDAEGNPIPPTRDAICALLSFADVFDAVEKQIVLPIFTRYAEKNG